ncbi:MAG: thioredoxin domain-containing protein, partial [Thermodesulfobacteriota bacterium]
MAHESFEDEGVASVLKESFVSIKVDREERPDVDRVYMTACQAMTKGGGWPLTIFMTPEGKPFFAGTYFPKESRMGMTGFVDLLKKISELWNQDRARFEQAGEQITEALQPRSEAAATGRVPDETVLSKACEQLASSFDPTWGGFGKAPKFPMPHNLTFLLRWYARSGTEAAGTMTGKTLASMRNGGIFDQIGFGFHRYSVDEQWLVPHFEKMLYDQALLALAYTEAYQAFGEDRYGTVAREIFTYVLRDMTSPEGG